MNTTNISQLELSGMVAGGDARTEGPIPPCRSDDAHRDCDVAPPERRGGNGAHANAKTKSGASRNAAESGAVETLLNFAEAARALGISLRQFRRLVDGGKVAFVRVSTRSPRVRPSELQRFLDASAVIFSENKS